MRRLPGRHTLGRHEPIQVRDAILREQAAEFGVPGVLAGLCLRDLGAIRGRAAQPEQFLEILERRRRPRARVAVVVAQQRLQRDLDARLAVAQVEGNVERAR